MLYKARLLQVVQRHLAGVAFKWLTHRCKLMGQPWEDIPDPMPAKIATNLLHNLEEGATIIMDYAPLLEFQSDIAYLKKIIS